MEYLSVTRSKDNTFIAVYASGAKLGFRQVDITNMSSLSIQNSLLADIPATFMPSGFKASLASQLTFFAKPENVGITYRLNTVGNG